MGGVSLAGRITPILTFPRRRGKGLLTRLAPDPWIPAYNRMTKWKAACRFHPLARLIEYLIGDFWKASPDTDAVPEVRVGLEMTEEE